MSTEWNASHIKRKLSQAIVTTFEITSYVRITLQAVAKIGPYNMALGLGGGGHPLPPGVAPSPPGWHPLPPGVAQYQNTTRGLKRCQIMVFSMIVAPLLTPVSPG